MILRTCVLTIVLPLLGFCMGFAAEDQIGFGPYSPDEAVRHFQIHPSCNIELVACEPDVIDPVHIEFSPDGKLWVVEYSDYPNGPAESQPGLSRIRVLTDDDNDGRFTDPVTFADKLLFANSLMLWNGGAIVTTNGKILFLKDTDADGKADHEEVWFEGFIVENPQLRHNHPTLGPDNKIYVANGLRGGNIVPGQSNPWGLADSEKPVSISGMDFCFDPLAGAYEAVSGMGQFGLCFDDWGNRFVCTNRNPCKQIVLEDKYLKRNPRLKVSQVFEDVSPAGEESKLFPISRTWTTSNLHANQFTAACGVTIYRGNELSSDFYGNSFTCDPTANLVHRDILTPRGATFTSRPGREGVEFLATKDEWFRPVNMAHGPDGALYVIDMYRAVIEHPQFMPEELKNRPDLGLGTDKGRIWRITSNPAKERPAIPHFAGLPSSKLVDFMNTENVWQRETARRLILERNEKEDATLLDQLAKLVNQSTDPRVINTAASTLAGLGAADRAIRLGIPNPVPANWGRVIEHALRIAESLSPSPKQEEAINQLRALSTQSPRPEWIDDRVPFQLALSFPVLKPDSPAMRQKFAFLSSLPEQARWMRLAFLSGIEPKEIKELELFDRYLHESVPLATIESRLKVYEELGALYSHFKWPDAVLVVPAGSEFSARSRFALLRGRLQRSSNTTDWRDPLHKQEAFVFELASAWAANTDKSRELREEAIQALIWTDSVLAVNALKGILRDSQQSALHSRCIQTLSYHNSPVAVDLLVDAYGSGSPKLRREIIVALARTSNGINRLLDEVKAERISRFEVDPGTVNALTRNKTYAARAKELLSRPVAQDRLQIIEQFASSLTMESDPLRGRVIFEKNCATCHKIGSVGVNVAPDISDSRTKTTEFLLTNILDPNRAIDNNYFSYTLVDTQGRIHTGVINSETSTSITLKQPEGKTITIARDEVDEFKNNGVSLMPVGLERTINQQQMADLISFIKNWRYLDGLVPKEVIR